MKAILEFNLPEEQMEFNRATPSKYGQSYFCKTPNTTSYDCEYYWEIETEEI